MADSVIKDRDGTDVEYTGVTKIKLNTVDGGTQIFSEGEAIESVEVSLDFSNGDQTITAPDGKLVKSAIIKKPDTLVPENIALDTIIAGVVGTFESGNFNTDNLVEIVPVTFVTVPSGGDGTVPLMQPIGLKTGSIYQILWNNVSYILEAKDISYNGIPAIAVGNGIAWGGEDNGLPFAIGEIPEEYVSFTGGAYGLIIPLDGSITFKIGGYLIRDVEKLNVNLDFSQGDMTVVPEAGKLINRVDIQKPATLVPENIAKDVNVAGVVGTHEGGGDIGTGAYFVKILDYDGTVIAQKNLNNGETFVLPTPPTHDRLVFDGWSASCEITDNIVTVENNNIIIGAMYHTASNATEVDVTLTIVTGLTVSLNSLNGMTSVDWGDGTTDSNLTHTYSGYGDYTIKIYGVTVISDCSTSASIVTPKHAVRTVFLGTSVTSIGNYALYNCYSLTNIVIPTSVTSIGNNAFNNCRSLTNIVIPTSVTSVSFSCFINCYALTNIMIPTSVTSIGNGLFNYCYSLTNAVIPSNATIIGSNLFNYCYSLTNVVIPASLTSVTDNLFSSCGSLTNVVIPASVMSIGKSAFFNCCSIMEYDFSACVSIPTLSNTNAFSGINNICKMLIPSALYSSWKAATNWSTYADYMVAV